jgi:hypothetical protein
MGKKLLVKDKERAEIVEKLFHNKRMFDSLSQVERTILQYADIAGVMRSYTPMGGSDGKYVYGLGGIVYFIDPGTDIIVENFHVEDNVDKSDNYKGFTRGDLYYIEREAERRMQSQRQKKNECYALRDIGFSYSEISDVVGVPVEMVRLLMYK